MSVLAFAFFFFKLVYNKDKNNLEFNNKCSHKAKSNKNNQSFNEEVWCCVLGKSLNIFIYFHLVSHIYFAN